MKKLILMSLLVLFGHITMAQSKEEKETYKTFCKEEMNVFNHKQFWKSDIPWTFTKISIHFKQITSDAALSVNKDVSKTSNLRTVEAKSWAILNGVSEQTFQEISDEFTALLKKRMKEECGIEIFTWSNIKDSPNLDKIMDKKRDGEIFNKDEGAAITKTADGGPNYSHVIVMIPGGKKLSKETGHQLAELDIILDFALFEMALNAYLASTETTWEKGWIVTTKTFRSEGSGTIYPVIHCAPQFGGSMGEGFLTQTKFFVQDKYLYSSNSNLIKPIVSQVEYASNIDKGNELPAEILDRYKVKWEHGYDKIFMYNVTTTDELYKKAAMDALNNYLDKLIYVFKYNQNLK